MKICPATLNIPLRAADAGSGLFSLTANAFTAGCASARHQHDAASIS